MWIISFQICLSDPPQQKEIELESEVDDTWTSSNLHIVSTSAFHQATQFWKQIPEASINWILQAREAQKSLWKSKMEWITTNQAGLIYANAWYLFDFVKLHSG